MVLTTILGRLQPEWIVNYHEHDSLLKHEFSEELSEEERKAAWDDYRAQIAKYDNATYYNALQNQLDATAAAGNGTLQLPIGQSSQPSTSSSGVKNEREILKQALMQQQQRQQQRQHQLQAVELLTVLKHTNIHVENLISLLREKVSLSAQHSDCVRRNAPVPTALMAKVALNNKNSTNHYALVNDGVTRVNSTLHKCHRGQIYLEPGTNKQANELRAKLITNLDILKSGSNNPYQALSLPRHPSTHAVAPGPSTSGASPGQLTQQQQQARQLQAEVKLGSSYGAVPSSSSHS